jgi:hypothetical protein
MAGQESKEDRHSLARARVEKLDCAVPEQLFRADSTAIPLDILVTDSLQMDLESRSSLTA